MLKKLLVLKAFLADPIPIELFLQTVAGVVWGGLSVRIRDEASVGQDLHALRRKASADFLCASREKQMVRDSSKLG